MTRRPIDGTAVILHLIEAVRAWNQPEARWCGQEERNLEEWANALETYLAEQIPDEQSAGWEPRTWGEVLTGDRVSAGGQEYLVKQAVVLNWHVESSASKNEGDRAFGVRQVWHPGRDGMDEEGKPEYCRPCKGRCARGRGFQTFPLEHSQIAVTLIAADGREGRFTMPTGGEIEVLRGEAGREIDRAAGRGAQIVKADRDMVLASWAGEAFQTLAAAGLSPEPQIMTMEGKA
jgi:hypothetical protein